MNPECRICYDGIDTEDASNRLFRPCLCRGTQTYIHENCLKSLRYSQVNRQSMFQCPTCKYKYRYCRIWFADIIINHYFISLLTILITLTMIAAIAGITNTFLIVFFKTTLNKRIFHRIVRITGYPIAIICIVIEGLFLIMSILAVLSGGSPGIDFMRGSANVNLTLSRDNIYENKDFLILGYIFYIFILVISEIMIYEYIEKYMKSIMSRMGERILEVED